jgi:hypothetical protein
MTTLTRLTTLYSPMSQQGRVSNRRLKNRMAVFLLMTLKVNRNQLFSRIKRHIQIFFRIAKMQWNLLTLIVQ